MEGTNLSEGRGTTRPFELFGAPFINPFEVKTALKGAYDLPGLVLRETWFQPTFHKWAGKVCGGFQLHVTDRQAFKPYFTALAILQVILQLYPDQFQWRQPPYEYEYDRLPFDLLTGDPEVREGLERGVPLGKIEQDWTMGLQEFLLKRQEYLFE